jgi:hypothetical protein
MDLVREARRIHAEGYVFAGFVNESAVIKDGPEKGTLTPDIDKARGPNVEYYLGIDGSNAKNCATLRRLYLPPGGSFRNLPAYSTTEQSLSPGGLVILEELEANGADINEIAALSRTEAAPAQAIYEILRTAIRDSMGKNRMWFVSMVSKTYDALLRRWGEDNLVRLGDDVVLEDDRVNDDIFLRPLLINPDTFHDNLLTAYRATGDRKLAHSLVFYTDGLRRDQMSDDVFAARQKLFAQV